MTYASTTTLNLIRAAQPCEAGWKKLLRGLDKTQADDEPLPLLSVLDICGLEDALWVLSYAMPDDRLARHYQAWCAEQVLRIFETERPGDLRVRDQIAMLRNDAATPEQRTAARNAAEAVAQAVAQAEQEKQLRAMIAARNEEWKQTKLEDPTFKCRQCGSDDVWYYEWKSSDGAFEDTHYECRGCGRDWWIEGADA